MTYNDFTYAKECFGVLTGTAFSLLSDIRSQQTSSSLHNRRVKVPKSKSAILGGAVFFRNASNLASARSGQYVSDDINKQLAVSTVLCSCVCVLPETFLVQTANNVSYKKPNLRAFPLILAREFLFSAAMMDIPMSQSSFLNKDPEHVSSDVYNPLLKLGKDAVLGFISSPLAVSANLYMQNKPVTMKYVFNSTRLIVWYRVSSFILMSAGVTVGQYLFDKNKI